MKTNNENIIKEKGRFNFLDEKLKEVSDLRLKYREESLENLSKILKISKSGLKHRFDKIIKIAEELE